MYQLQEHTLREGESIANGPGLHTDRPAVSRSQDPLTTIILPAYNEEVALPAVLADLQSITDESFEIIVVDDASTDRTAEIARAFPCTLIRHDVNRGKGAAVRTGLTVARGELVIIMDADNTYPASAVRQMVTMSADADLVRAVRSNGLAAHSPRINTLGNKLFDLALSAVHGLEGGDHLSGLYGLRRSALLDMQLTADRFDLEVEIGIKARALGLRSATVPIAYQPRLGEKKLRPWRDGWAILRRMLLLRFQGHPALMAKADA